MLATLLLLAGGAGAEAGTADELYVAAMGEHSKAAVAPWLGRTVTFDGKLEGMIMPDKFFGPTVIADTRPGTTLTAYCRHALKSVPAGLKDKEAVVLAGTIVGAEKHFPAEGDVGAVLIAIIPPIIFEKPFVSVVLDTCELSAAR